jgi:hypothetical protein
MREISDFEVQMVSGALAPAGDDVYYSMGHAIGEGYAWLVDKTSRAIEWVANHL